MGFGRFEANPWASKPSLPEQFSPPTHYSTTFSGALCSLEYVVLKVSIRGRTRSVDPVFIRGLTLLSLKGQKLDFKTNVVVLYCVVLYLLDLVLACVNSLRVLALGSAQ